MVIEWEIATQQTISCLLRWLEMLHLSFGVSKHVLPGKCKNVSFVQQACSKTSKMAILSLINTLACQVIRFAAVGLVKYASSHVKGDFLFFLMFLALLLYCFLTESVPAWNKVIINHASVINPQTLHSPIYADNETRHKPLTSF